MKKKLLKTIMREDNSTRVKHMSGSGATEADSLICEMLEAGAAALPLGRTILL